MMRKLWLTSLVGILALALASAASAEEKKKIAVGDFYTKGGGNNTCRGWPSDYGNTLAASMRSRLAETGAFKVLSREQMLKVLKEHELPMTGLADAEKAKLTGQWLQADLIVGGDFICHATNFEFNINLIDIEKNDIVWSKVYEMKDIDKMSRALKDMTKLMADYAKTGSIGKDAGKSETLMMIDSKALRYTSERIKDVIVAVIPKVSGKVVEVNVNNDDAPLKVKVSGAAWPGYRLQFKRSDTESEWLYLKKKGPGTVEANTTGEPSFFEEGAQLTSEEFKPKIAFGYIEDEDESNEKFLELFKDGITKEMAEDENLEFVDDNAVDKILMKMGAKTNKKELEKLHKKGVDLIITGRFSGANGKREANFDVINTFDGKQIAKIKGDTRGL